MDGELTAEQWKPLWNIPIDTGVDENGNPLPAAGSPFWDLMQDYVSSEELDQIVHKWLERYDFDASESLDKTEVRAFWDSVVGYEGGYEGRIMASLFT